MQTLLANPTSVEHVRAVTTNDVVYVSLNFDNPELHKVMPWTGTNRGPQSIVDVFNGIARVWETKAFEIRDVIANDTAVAIFGSFTYKTRVLGKQITSPFALLAKVTGDKISYVQLWKTPLAQPAPSARAARGTFVASQPAVKSALDLNNRRFYSGARGVPKVPAYLLPGP